MNACVLGCFSWGQHWTYLGNPNRWGPNGPNDPSEVMAGVIGKTINSSNGARCSDLTHKVLGRSRSDASATAGESGLRDSVP